MRHFLKHISFVSLTQIAVQARAFFLLPILTKMLGAYDFGLWTQVMVTIEFFLPIISLSLHSAIVRFLSAESARERLRESFFTILMVVFFVDVVVCLALFTGSSFIAERFFDGQLIIVRLLVLVIFVQALFIMLLALLRALRKIGLFCIFLLVDSYGSLVLIFYFILLGRGISGATIALLSTKITLLLILLATVIWKIGFAWPRFRDLREYLRYSLPSVPSNIAGWFVQLSDRYIISFFLGISAVGYYSPAYTLGGLLMLMIEPFSLVLTPYVARLYDSGNREAVRRYLAFSMKLLTIVLVPTLIGVSLLSESLLRLLSTEEVARNAFFITPFVAASIALYGAIVVVSEIISLGKKTRVLSLTWIIAGAVNLILNIVLIPFIGIVGAAIATLAAYVIVFVYLYYYSRRFIVISIDVHSLMKSILISAPLFLILIIKPQSIMGIVITAICGIAVYLLLALLIRLITPDEIAMLRRMAGRQSEPESSIVNQS